MSEDLATVRANCPKCGTAITWDGDTVTDDTILACKNCGFEGGSYGDFKRKAMAAIKERARRMIKDAFKR